MRVIDRSGWPAGPWDQEPDEVSWQTAAGLPAMAFRLKEGTWACQVTAPHIPSTGPDWMFYVLGLKELLVGHPSVGIVSKTDVENVGNFCVSFEHFQSPVARDRSWGPYATLEVVKHCAENLAMVLQIPSDQVIAIRKR